MAAALLAFPAKAIAASTHGHNAVDVRASELFPAPKNPEVLQAFDELTGVLNGAIEQSADGYPQDFPRELLSLTQLTEPGLRAGVVGVLPDAERLASQIRTALDAYRQSGGSMAVFKPFVLNLVHAREQAYRDVDMRTEWLSGAIESEEIHSGGPDQIAVLHEHSKMLDALSWFFDRDERLTRRARRFRQRLLRMERERNERAIAALDPSDLSGEDASAASTKAPILRSPLAAALRPAAAEETAGAGALAAPVPPTTKEHAVAEIRRAKIDEAWNIVQLWRNSFLEHVAHGTSMLATDALRRIAKSLQRVAESDLKDLRSIERTDPDFPVFESAAMMIELLSRLHQSAVDRSTTIGEFFKHLEGPMARVENAVRSSSSLRELEASIAQIVMQSPKPAQPAAAAKADDPSAEAEEDGWQDWPPTEEEEADDLAFVHGTLERWRELREEAMSRRDPLALDPDDGLELLMRAPDVRIPVLLISHHYASAGAEALDQLKTELSSAQSIDAESTEAALFVISQSMRLDQTAVNANDIHELEDRIDELLGAAIDLDDARESVKTCVDDQTKRWTN